MLKTEDLATVLFEKGEILFEKNDQPDDLAYIVKSGSVAITSKVGSEDVLIDTLTRGDFVGEMALIDNEPRSATAVALEDTICSVVTKQEIDRALEDADLLAYMLMRTLTRRLRKTTSRADAYFTA